MAISASTEDDEDSGSIVAAQRPQKHPQNASLDLDDAFSLSDGDDDPRPAFALSSASIHAELARSHQFSLRDPEGENGVDTEDAVIPVSNGRSEHSLKDTSVSTIDIGGPALGFPPSPAQSTLSHTPEESERSNEFSQVSLSEDSVPEHDEAHEDLEQELGGDTGAGESLPYTTVHIDASKPRSSRIELAPAYVSSDAHLDPPPQNNDHHQPHAQEQNQNDQDHPRELLPPNSAPASSSTYSVHQLVTSPPLTPASTSPITSLGFYLISLSSLTICPRPQTYPLNGPKRTEVVSRTRPAYLPPKPKQEDNKHMADWDHMMKLSREAGKYHPSLAFLRFRFLTGLIVTTLCSPPATNTRGKKTTRSLCAPVSPRTKDRGISVRLGTRHHYNNQWPSCVKFYSTSTYKYKLVSKIRERVISCF
jgi:hypothetical protein